MVGADVPMSEYLILGSYGKNLVKAFHSPSELYCSALEHAWLHVPLFLSILMGLSLIRVWTVLLFFQTLTCSSLLVVALIFTAEFYAIDLTLSCISVHNSNNFVIYCDS